MKRLTLFIVFVFSVAAISSAVAGRGVVVLTSLDVIQTMGEVLANDTSITVTNVIPEGYSMRGQDAYFKKHQKVFLESAAKADAVLTVGAAWAADPLYKWARRGNIRIVNIDAAKPLDEYGAGVPLVEVDEKYSPFVWRSPANLTRMASIAADDLCRVFPADADTIKSNLKTLQIKLFKLRSKYEGAFLDLDFVALAALTSGYTYLADEFGLDIQFYLLKPGSEWTETDVQQFSARLKRSGVKAVICSWEPDPKVQKSLKEGGVNTVVLKKFVREKNSDPLAALVEWYEGNLSRLHNGLKK